MSRAGPGPRFVTTRSLAPGRYVNRRARAYLHSFQYVREIGIVREDREVAILISSPAGATAGTESGHLLRGTRRDRRQRLGSDLLCAALLRNFLGFCASAANAETVTATTIAATPSRRTIQNPISTQQQAESAARCLSAQILHRFRLETQDYRCAQERAYLTAYRSWVVVQ